MSDQHNLNDELPRPPRKLSRFLAREMLYDYVSNHLDKDRKVAVEDFISQDIETKQELKSLQAGIEYCNLLAETKISEPLINEIRDHRGLVGKTLNGTLWKDWPDTIKWAIEATLIAGFAGLIIFFIPWKKIGSFLPKSADTVTLVEVDKSSQLTNEMNEKVAKLEGDSINQLPAVAPSLPEKSKVESVALNSKNQINENTSEIKNQPKPPPPVEEGPDLNLKNQTNSNNVDEDVDAPGTVAVDGVDSTDLKEKKSLKGFVFRAFMNLEELDRDIGLITSEIIKLGGEKAGQVELGWRKPNGSYYHFSMPANNQEELLKSLRQFGPVRVYKDPHWRIMPEGQVRFILWVEDNKAKK